MISFSIFKILFLTVLLTIFTDPLINASSCGSVIEGVDEGSIVHNSSSSEQNERCLWILRSWNHTSIVVSYNSTGNESFLSISTFTRAFPLIGNTQPLLTNQRLSGSGNLTLPGPIAVVTFANNETYTSAGFSLAYSFQGSAPSNISTTSVTLNINEGLNDSGNVTHPSEGTYGNSELSIVQLPLPYPALTLYRLEIHEMEWNRDFVYVYNFNVTHGWSFNIRYTLAGIYLLVDEEMALFVFNSDNAYSFRGFSLSWLHDVGRKFVG